MIKCLPIASATLACILMLAACSPAHKAPNANDSASQPPEMSLSQAANAPSVANLPAGDYTTDKSHTSLTFNVSHLSFSNYTARFATFDAKLKIDPAHPELAQLSATIDPLSLELPSPPKGFHDELMGTPWFDAKAFPKITFVSTKIDMTGANTANVTGDLTLHGISKPVTMSVIFNGGYPGLAGFDPNARIGFSATGELKRSDFGISYGIPAAGSTMGVSDLVKFNIETEMSGPALKAN